MPRLATNCRRCTLIGMIWKTACAVMASQWPALSAAAADDELVFRVHIFNAESQFSSAAVLDVDHDGDPDVVSGGFWYEGPTWEKHFVRDVENINGRYDDYSNLPLDVDRDGWTDLVSVNYRSRTIYWVKHPVDLTQVWTRQLIDTPGHSETGRLFDIDDDGDADLLPNGTDFAAWYEFVATERGESQWRRHDLPIELAAHGIGFGDINGDGRGDIVGSRGWAEAPLDRVQDDWTWRPEFDLGAGISIPILIEDPDADGDRDLIAAHGHDFGLFWLEQDFDTNGMRTWTSHVIDDSWSCAHALLWADLNGDGRDDLIAGKRYLGHDGRDPGETEPLCVYWYGFDRAAHAWQRHLIHEGGTVGMDLDPKAADLDGDGDIDLVAPARCGLHWLENLRIDSP